ncbi:MAG TPA: hypothetical protein VG826_28575 [Pirellulales bacterium]|nr:hypothetical protein [Pirellulales bacterium]
MIALLDTIGPAVWRASWQAAALAVPVMLLLWCLGERLSPRWRFLLWSVVLARLLMLVAPASPWSVFNLVRLDPGGDRAADPRCGIHAGSASLRRGDPPARNASHLARRRRSGSGTVLGADERR